MHKELEVMKPPQQGAVETVFCSRGRHVFSNLDGFTDVGKSSR